MLPVAPFQTISGDLGTIVFASLMVLLGGGLFWAGYTGYRGENREIARAHETLATVTASAVGEELEIDGGDMDTTYYPAVSYGYRFDGRDYTGTRVWAGSVDHRGLQTTGFRIWAEEWVGRFPVGSEVPVFVNPSAPEEAFLAVRSRRHQFVVSLATVLAGLALAAWGVSRLLGITFP
jgi:hypothetical protein